LPINEKKNKKIAYLNPDKTNNVFSFKSSDPKLMKIKFPTIEIAAGERAKCGLRFTEYPKQCEKKFVITVKKNGMTFESILLVVQYKSEQKEG